MAARPAPRVLAHLAGFARKEDGALIILALFFFVLMAMMGGVAIDLMKNENIRTQLTQTLDRCTLMAASLDQRLDPETVVTDCVNKAGLSSSLRSVVVLDGENARDVKAVARADSQPFFMHMIGIESFDAAARARAVQRITNVELSLVLDVSGSMQGTKIANLKTAASNFVATMIDNDTGGRTAISLVPYNGQVNLGSALRSRFTTVDNHGVANANCVDLPSGVYGATAMSRTTPMPMTAHADTFSTTWASNGYLNFADGWSTPNNLNRWCPPMASNVVRLPSDNVAMLQSQINGLQAIGATSINAGMKWGLTLLDPASRPMFGELAGMGAMSGEFTDRPYDYTDSDTLKVIVLMTDGAHFAEERVNDGYRMGLSPIYRANGSGQYSIRHASRAGTNKFYVPHLNAWQATAFSSGSGTTQQTWQQVWANQRMTWVAWQLYARAFGTDDVSRNAQYDAAMNLFRTRTDTNAMDAQLQQICTLAKAQDVLVFGIAFEAPAGGQAQISQCASSPQHYFNAQGLEIATAFDSIANNLTMLKLTQ